MRYGILSTIFAENEVIDMKYRDGINYFIKAVCLAVSFALAGSQVFAAKEVSEGGSGELVAVDERIKALLGSEKLFNAFENFFNAPVVSNDSPGGNYGTGSAWGDNGQKVSFGIQKYRSFLVWLCEEGTEGLFQDVEADLFSVVNKLVESGEFFGEGLVLHVAACFNNVSIIEHLVNSRQFDVDTPNADGSTALIYATKYGAVDAVRVLLELGADYKRSNKSEVTALSLAQRDEEIKSIFDRHQEAVLRGCSEAKENETLDRADQQDPPVESTGSRSGQDYSPTGEGAGHGSSVGDASASGAMSVAEEYSDQGDIDSSEDESISESLCSKVCRYLNCC